VFEFQGWYMAKSFCVVVNRSTYILVLRPNSQFIVKCDLCSLGPCWWDPSLSSKSFSLVFTQQALQLPHSQQVPIHWLGNCHLVYITPPICKYLVLEPKLCLCNQINDNRHYSIVYISMWCIMKMSCEVRYLYSQNK